MRIVFPAWSLRKFDWDRFQIVLKQLHVKSIQVYTYDQTVVEAPSWCSIIHVAHPPNIMNLDAACKYAVDIISKLDDFDLVYCWSSGAYFQLVNVLVAQLAKKPIVMHINGDGALSRYYHLSTYDKLREDTVDNISLNNIDKLIPISSKIADSIRPRLLNPQRLTEPIPFSVDTSLFTPSRFPSQITVGYSGRISPEKGTPFLFEVAEATKESQFRFAGPIQMAAKFPDNCHYDGCFPYADMPLFYNLCSVVALPSYGEGMPAAILEAYSCGKPVICTPESRPRELKLFGWELPRDTSLWTSRISILDQAEIESMGIKARSWITEEFPGWKSFGESMKKAFDAVIP